MDNRSCVIANPAAGRGTSRDSLRILRREFAERGFSNFRETAVAGHEERLTTNALEKGATLIVAIGGDGTCTRIANAILASGKRCGLAVLPTGTGNDFAKTLGVADLSPQEIADLIKRGDMSQTDVGRADGYHFLNSCGFGFDAAVLEASNRVRFLKGDAVYIYSALAQLFTYRGVEVSAKWDSRSQRESMLMVTVSNGRFLGGAFRIAPDASVTDGKLDVCMFADVRLWKRPKLFAAALRGTHPRIPSVATFATAGITFTFPAPPSMEIDGELRQGQSRTVRVECIPRALSVIAAPGALT